MNACIFCHVKASAHLFSSACGTPLQELALCCTPQAQQASHKQQTQCQAPQARQAPNSGPGGAIHALRDVEDWGRGKIVHINGLQAVQSLALFPMHLDGAAPVCLLLSQAGSALAKAGPNAR